MMQKGKKITLTIATLVAFILGAGLIFTYVGRQGPADDSAGTKTSVQTDSDAAVVWLVWDGSAVQSVGIDDFSSFIRDTELPVFVDFWAEWCGPCREAAPFVESLAQTYDERALIVKVDVDRETALASQYEVRSIPLFVLFQNGEPVDHVIGYTSAMDETLMAMIDQYLN